MEEQAQHKRIAGVYESHWGAFLRFVKRRVREIAEMDAEDIVDEVLVNLLSRSELTAHVENLLAYVYSSLANRIADLHRRRAPDVSLDASDALTGLSLSDSVPDSTASVDQAMSREFTRQRLREAISRLDPKQRAVWLATEVQGRSFRDLSAEWNEPVGTLLSRKSRATQALRRYLSDLSDSGGV